jgi:hypothetical protein
MLFNYRYVNHSIEGFQVYLDHLVKEVWCKAAGDFSLDLLHPDLRAIVMEIYDTEENVARGRISDWLYGPIQEIFDLFKNLDPAQRQQISNWYDNNNDIEALCAGDPLKPPATYTDIRVISATLETVLKDFCKSLFTNVIELKAVTSRIGEIDAHYSAFVKENDENRCPYCGYGAIKDVHYTRREAYDHFLPKATYPFNSVNFHNLTPMCHECNSTYKLEKDPIRRKAEGVRRKAFYSYSTVASGINVMVALTTKDVTDLKPDEIELQLEAPGHEEEVETWKDVFGIEERYKAKLCGRNEGKAWVQKIGEEWDNVGLTREQLLAYELSAAERRPYADANFLKKPFLIACQSAGIF